MCVCAKCYTYTSFTINNIFLFVSIQQSDNQLQEMSASATGYQTGNTVEALSLQDSRCIFSFGVLADAQYADADNGMSYDKSRHRYYRPALTTLENAVRAIENTGNDAVMTHESTSFILQLGDLIDGKTGRMGKIKEALEKISSVFEIYKGPIHHVVGNHELYNFSKLELKSTAMFGGTVSDEGNHHKKPLWKEVVVHPGYRLVILDCYDVSVLGHGRDATTSEDYLIAKKIIRQNNSNRDWNASDDLQPDKCHYTAYNGAIGKKQLEWLAGVLQTAEANSEVVIIAGKTRHCLHYQL